MSPALLELMFLLLSVYQVSSCDPPTRCRSVRGELLLPASPGLLFQWDCLLSPVRNRHSLAQSDVDKNSSTNLGPRLQQGHFEFTGCWQKSFTFLIAGTNSKYGLLSSFISYNHSSGLSKLNLTSCITFCNIFQTNDPAFNPTECHTIQLKQYYFTHSIIPYIWLQDYTLQLKPKKCFIQLQLRYITFDLVTINSPS